MSTRAYRIVERKHEVISESLRAFITIEESTPIFNATYSTALMNIIINIGICNLDDDNNGEVHLWASTWQRYWADRRSVIADMSPNERKGFEEIDRILKRDDFINLSFR